MATSAPVSTAFRTRPRGWRLTMFIRLRSVVEMRTGFAFFARPATEAPVAGSAIRYEERKSKRARTCNLFDVREFGDAKLHTLYDLQQVRGDLASERPRASPAFSRFSLFSP